MFNHNNFIVQPRTTAATSVTKNFTISQLCSTSSKCVLYVPPSNKKPQIYSHIKTESKILHNGADTQDWLRNTEGPNQRICSSSQGQVYAMKQYLSKQKTGNLCIILYPSNLLLAIILLICTIFRALLTFLCILISKEIIMTWNKHF